MKSYVLAATIALTASLAPLPQATASGDEARAVNLRMPRFAKPAKGPSYRMASQAAFNAAKGVVDLNGDGIAEIVQAFAHFPGSPNTPVKIAILKYIKDKRHYAWKTSQFVDGALPAMVHPRVTEVGDFNKDGKADFFMGAHGYDTPPFPGEPDWLLMSRPGQKHVAVVAPPGTNEFTHASAAGDVNDDGITDIFVGTLSSLNYFLLGQNGANPVADTSSLNSTVSNGAVSYTAGELIDADGDGDKDLMLGSSGGSDNVIYFNDGTGKFLNAVPDMVLPPALFGQLDTISVDTAVADVDTDGRTDLLVLQTDYTPFYTGYGIQVLRNTGSGFVDETSRLKNGSGFRATGSWISQLYPVDLYGDGITDLLGSIRCDNLDATYTYWVNDGSGQFTPKKFVPVKPNDSTASCNVIYPVDVNGDRRTDFVQMNVSGGRNLSAWLYRNRGPGTSGTPTRAQVVRQPVNDIVALGERFSISASVRGTRPLRFQWFKNGVAIPGARKPVLTIASATAETAGAYKLRIRNAAGDRFTDEVTISVAP